MHKNSNKELLERVIENAPCIIIGTDMEGRITIFNEVAEMVTGYSKNEALDREFLSLLIQENGRDETRIMFQRTNQGVPLYNIEKNIMTKNGEEKVILWSSAKVEDDQKNLIGEIFIGNDITEKSIMINEIIRQNKELTAINSVGLSISNSSELDVTLKSALQRALELINPAGGAIYVLDEVGAKLKIFTSFGISQKLSNEFQSFKIDRGIPWKVIKSSHHVVLNDLSSLSERSRKHLEEEGFSSMAFIPIRSRRGGLGVLVLGSKRKERLTPVEIKVFKTISNQIGIIMDNARLSNELSMVGMEWENTFNTISDPMVLVSIDEKILWVNIAYARLMGSIPETLVGKKCCDIFHDSRSPIKSCVHKKVFESSLGFTQEMYDEETGTTSHVTCSPYKNAQGELKGTLIIARDITEKKEKENEVRYLKEFNENIVENLGDGLEIIGPDHRIQYMNRGFLEAVGKDVIGKTCYEVHFESDSPCAGCPVDGNIKDMQTKAIECQAQDGKSYLITHSPLRNADGTYSAILLFKNMDRLSAPEPEIKGVDNYEIGSLIQGIKHEISNPIGGITESAEVLSEEEDPLKIRLYAKEISDSAARINKLLESLIRLSRVKVSSYKDEIDLNEVIINSLNMMNQHEKFASVEVETDLSQVPKIRADPLEILSVFINLITNSLENMGQQGKIQISTKIQNGTIQLSFRDTAAEIPSEHLDKIFDPFYGLKGNTENGEGEGKRTGLRMYTVHQILKKYKAPITVKSTPGSGNAFTINFPYEKENTNNAYDVVS